MFAIVETGGKQYKVEPDSVIKVEKLEGKEGEEIILTKVLAVEKMGELKTGTPYLSGASVKAQILTTDLDKKLTVFQYKPKKRIRVKNGHRQPYTMLKVKSINFNA